MSHTEIEGGWGEVQDNSILRLARRDAKALTSACLRFKHWHGEGTPKIAIKGQTITYSVTIVTSVPWDTERVLRLVKTHMGKCLFSPELKSYLITQWNCTTIGSCRCRKRTNGSAAELHEPMATIRANIPAETGGASGYISGRFAIGSSGLLRLKRRLSRAATWHGKVRSTRSVSQGTEVTIVTEYVPYRYSTRTASCKDAYGNWI